MANQRIWAPWRLRYVKDAKHIDECIFCAKPEHGRRSRCADRPPGRALLRDAQPVPLHERPPDGGAVRPRRPPAGDRRRGDRGDDGARPARDEPGWRRSTTPRASTSGSTRAGSPAPGVEGHIHLHVVPRWAGDNNYMPVLADTRVMPQSLEESYDALLKEASVERDGHGRRGRAWIGARGRSSRPTTSAGSTATRWTATPPICSAARSPGCWPTCAARSPCRPRRRRRPRHAAAGAGDGGQRCATG